MLDHYLHTAHAAALALNPSREPITLAPARPGVTPERLTSHHAALAWFEAEHHVLIATVTHAADTGHDIHAWQLPWAMTTFLDGHGHWHQQATLLRTALEAAIRLGDTAAQATALRQLAMACAMLGDYDQARTQLAEALAAVRKPRRPARPGPRPPHLRVRRAAPAQLRGRAGPLRGGAGPVPRRG